MTIEMMMNRMASVMWFNGKWHARVRGCSLFGKAFRLEDALILAIQLDDDEL